MIKSNIEKGSDGLRGLGAGLLIGLSTNIFVAYMFRILDGSRTPQDLRGFSSGFIVLMFVFLIIGLGLLYTYILSHRKGYPKKIGELLQNARDNLKHYFKGVKQSEKIRETIGVFEKERKNSIALLKEQGKEKDIPKLNKMFDEELMKFKEAQKFLEDCGL